MWHHIPRSEVICAALQGVKSADVEKTVHDTGVERRGHGKAQGGVMQREVLLGIAQVPLQGVLLCPQV